MKQRNPRFGCRRIAMQINNIFGTNIDKDVVRRILNKHYIHITGGDGPSWLNLMANAKDSLWSIDFFRAESILLKSHWIMVVMDLFTRRIIGFAVHCGSVDGPTTCRMFNKIVSRKTLPKYLSSDNAPLFQYHQWKANLRIFEIEEVKSIPYVPCSHPFVESLIKFIRFELLDNVFFWNSCDLERKLRQYQSYFNSARSHMGINGKTPKQKMNGIPSPAINLRDHQWVKHCNGMFQLPIAA